MRQFRVLVNDNEYKVAIEELREGGNPTSVGNNPRQEAKQVAANPVPNSAKPKVGESKPQENGDVSGIVAAAMPGTILDIKVSAGQSVERGQPLLILEAMKMENEIMAPQDGVIAEIRATVGASVNSGDVLIVMS